MNENVLLLELISPFSAETHKVSWIAVETPTGNFTLCIGHAPLASILKKKSQLSYQSLDGKDFTLEIPSGFIVISERIATIFID